MIDSCLTTLLSVHPLKLAARAVFALIVCLASASPVWAKGEHVIVVRSSEAAPYLAAEAALKQRLDSLGVASRTVTLASLEKNIHRKTFGDGMMDAYIAVGSPATIWLYHRLRKDIPLVSCMVNDRIATKLDGRRGLVALSMQLSLDKQFEILKEAIPDARNIGMLYASKNKSSLSIYHRALAQSIPGCSITAIDVDQYPSKSAAIKALFKLSPDVIWTDGDTAVYSVAIVRALLLGAMEHKTPVFGFSIGFVRSGALLGIGVDPAAQGVSAALMTRALFDHGAEPGDRNADEVTITKTQHSILAVNLIVADQINATLNKAFLAQASKVFR